MKKEVQYVEMSATLNITPQTLLGFDQPSGNNYICPTFETYAALVVAPPQTIDILSNFGYNKESEKEELSTMKITVNQALEFEMLYDRIKNDTLPTKLIFKLTKLYNAIVETTEPHRLELANVLNKYAEKDASGNFVLSEDHQNIKVAPDKLEACAQELSKLQNKEIILTVGTKITLDELDALQVTMQEMQALIPFIDE